MKMNKFFLDCEKKKSAATGIEERKKDGNSDDAGRNECRMINGWYSRIVDGNEMFSYEKGKVESASEG